MKSKSSRTSSYFKEFVLECFVCWEGKKIKAKMRGGIDFGNFKKEKKNETLNFIIRWRSHKSAFLFV